MSKHEAEIVLRHIRRLASVPSAQLAPDRQLLERFLVQREETAFAALVERHGAMVLRVCRRILHDSHEAEDAFQATFLILARQAGTIRQQASLGSWLYRVAYRVAVRARAGAARREELASRAPRSRVVDPLAEVSGRELLSVLDDELRRLPEKYRAPLVLCYLEGHTQDEAARQLGWSPQTLRGRVDRGRTLLRRRLVRRGFGLSAMGVASLLEQAPAAVPALLTTQTLRTVLGSFQGSTAAVSAHIAALAETGIGAFAAAKLKLVVPVILMLGILAAGLGAGFSALREPAPPPSPKPSPDEATAQAKEELRRDRYGDPLPNGAVMRFGTVRLRHASGKILAFSAKGNTLTSAGADKVLRVWETTSGRLLRKLPGPRLDEHFYWEAVCAAHGSSLVTFRNDRPALVFWNLTTGEMRRTLPWDGRRANALALSPDGRTLAVVAEDGTLRLLDAETGKPRRPPLRLRRRSRNVVFSPDGKLLGAGGEDGPIDLWDAAGEHLRRITTNDSTLAFSPDGKWSASVGRGRAVTLRTQATGTARHTLSLPAPDTFVRPICLAFSHNGQLLAAGGDGRPIVVWDAASRKERYRLPVGFATAALFSPDDDVLATSGYSTIRLWDAATGRELHAADGHAGEVNTLAVSADGTMVASGSWEDHTIRLWDRASGRQRHLLAGHTAYIRAVALSPDGKTLFSGGGDGTIRQWDTVRGEPRRVFRMKGAKGEEHQVFAMRLSSDGRTLAALSVGFGDPHEKAMLWVWDVVTSKEQVKRTLDWEAWFSKGFSPDGKTVVTLRGGELVLVEVMSGRHRQLSLPGVRPSAPCVFSSDGQFLAMRSHAGAVGREAVAVFDVAKGRLVQMLATGAVGFVAFSPDRRYLATADRDSLRLWELATGREVLRRPAVEGLAGHFGNAFISSLAFTPDGRSLVTGLPDTTILLWSLDPDGIPAHPLEPDAETLTRWWNDLGRDDGRKGYTAVWSFTTAPPEKTLAFLLGRLRPASEIDSDRVAMLMENLDSAEFVVRERAFQALEKLGEDVRPYLRRALDRKPSLEVRKRLEALLSRTETLRSGDILRGVRGVEVLERINTTEALRMLAKLAKGADKARLTREAKASLDRLRH